MSRVDLKKLEMSPVTDFAKFHVHFTILMSHVELNEFTCPVTKIFSRVD